MARANILFIVSVSWSVETPLNYRLPSNRASDDDEDDVDVDVDDDNDKVI